MTQRSDIEHGPRSVVMVIYPQVASVDVAGPLQAFALANFLTGRRLYTPATASVDGAPVPASGGFLRIEPVFSFSTLPDRIDLLLVSGGPGSVAACEDRQLLDWLRALEPRSARMGAVCTGSIVLAASGLLDGRRFATHWHEAPRLRPDGSGAQVDADAIYINSGKFWTSGGMLAGVDLALALIEADHGRQLALDVARFMVLVRRRSGGQSQFSDQLRAEMTEDPRIRRIQMFIFESPDADLSVKQLADRAAMSERSLLRVFKRTTRMTLGSYIEEVRLGRARSLLETSDLRMEAIVERSGFGSASNLRRVFRRRLGVTPSRYRANFGPEVSRGEAGSAAGSAVSAGLAHVTGGQAMG